MGRAIALLMLAASLSLGQGTHADPDGLFELGPLPGGWQAQRQQAGDGLWLTTIGPAQPGQANVVVLTLALEPGAAEPVLETDGRELIDTILGMSGQVGNKRYALIDGGPRPMLGCDFDVTVPDLGTRQGTARAMFSRGQAILAMATAAPDDDHGFQTARQLLDTLALPGETRAAGPAPDGGLFTADGLDGLRQRISRHGGDGADTVLVDGQPPLTESSVRYFVDYVSYLFGIRFTEMEYGLTRERFVEFYEKADAAGREILATGGRGLYAEVQQSSEQEKADLRRQMSAQFEAGAQQGIVWARALWEAISRRQRNVGQTTAKPPRQAQQAAGAGQLDSQFSEADLAAAVEMLYFMWVAAGRDPAAATPEVLAQVQAALVRNFGQFPADFQSVLCNAERVYAAIRGAWEQTDDAGRRQMAGEFAGVLDGLGLTTGGGGDNGGGGGDAWSDVNPEDVTSGLVVNTCWNLAQRSTGGW